MPNTRQLFERHIAKTNRFPSGTEISHSEGIYMFEPDGTRIWDMISGICVSSLGHRHPVVVKAIKDQVDQYMHTMVYGEFILTPQARLAGALTAALPDPLDCVYFTMSGSEAVEGALKTARRFTGRTEIIACKDAYHGSTMGAMTLMSDEYYTSAFRPLIPDVRHISFNSRPDINEITESTACVIFEPIQAEAGILLPEDGYLESVRSRCDEVGALLIFDEIQVGMGRTGKLYAFEHYGVVPDILLTAKGLGGGMPIGAFVARKEVLNAITENPSLGHITTFGGHPVSCAAGLATVEHILSSDVLNKVEEKGKLFAKLLDHPLVKEIRQIGLMIGLDFQDSNIAPKIIQRCVDQERILLDFLLFNERTLRLAPPLIISNAQIYRACQKIRNVMDAYIEENDL